MRKIKINIKYILFIIIAFTVFYTLGADSNAVAEISESKPELVQEDANLYYHLRIDKATIAKGYTVTAFDDELKLSLMPGVLEADTPVEIIELHEKLPFPWQLDKISNVLQFEFKAKHAYQNQTPFYIQFDYSAEDNRYKQVFFYDKNYSSWRPLPTRDFPKEHFVRSLIHLPYARIAVFAYPDTMIGGRASWYGYKKGNFCASPDYPKNSRLRVTNVENDKFVDVVVNDYGPDRSLHPDRAIDLDKTAFARIASLGEGVIDTLIEPLYIPVVDGKIMDVPPEGVSDSIDSTVKSAVIMDENSGKLIWSKNATTTLPLASLTKLVAMKVFLNTKPTLNTVVSYSVQDEEHNYEYVKPWESAKLHIEDGETLTVGDLLYSALVGSANNAVESLVRVSGLTRPDFIKEMNNLVASWGASSTHFIEPTGLAPENVSSALDYAIIAKEVLKNPIIAKASVAKEYIFHTINKGVRHRLKNTDKILFTNNFSINGSKTGYLDEAGYCLMTRVNVNPFKNIIVVTFGADSRNESFSETSRLVRFGLRYDK